MKKSLSFLIFFTCLFFLSTNLIKACGVIASPTNLQPVNSTTPGPQKITWNPVTGATNYLVRVHNIAAGTWVCTTSGTEACTGTTNTYYPYNFIASNTYSIWVHAVDSCGNISNPTSITVKVTSSYATPPVYTPINPTNLFVATDGNDANPGTLDSPFKTISHARDVVKTINQNMSGDIVVNLRGGYYQLDSTLTLDPTDSGTNGHFVVYQSYPGEVAEISGGKTVTGWVQDDTSVRYKAFVGTGIDSRQLYVNGVRAIRATGTASPTVVATWKDLIGVEAVDRLKGWQEHRCPIAGVSGSTYIYQQPCQTNAAIQGVGGTDYGGMTGTTVTSLNNAFELLDTPGEWYLNKSTGYIYYIPRTGENMTTAIGVLPTLETLVQANGTLTTSIQNIKFQNLLFAYATWLGPNTGVGFINTQAEYYINAKQGWSKTPANVTVSYGQNITFANNIFIHLGAVGLNIDTGSKNNSIVGNYFTDISSGAATIGDVSYGNTTDDRLITRGNQFIDNVIHDVAVEYHSAADVLVGYTQATVLKHNLVYNSTWEGLAIGWGWSTNPTVAKNNTVELNNVFNVCQGFGDCGGIYSLSNQPGNIYSQNYVHNVLTIVAASYGGPDCLYLDNGSANLTVSYNLLVQCNENLKNKCNSTCGVYGNDGSAGGQYANVIAYAGLDAAYLGIKNLPGFPTPTTSTPPPTTAPIAGDFNHDGVVNFSDYQVIISAFGNPYTIFDYNNLVANFGK